MSKKVKRLFEGFQPANYQIEINPDRETKKISGTAVITGQKTGRPSQRLTFHQHGLTVTEATITKRDKKGEQSFTAVRISHHKSYDEVRLHTEELLYAGQYTITLKYTGKVQDSMHGVYLSNYELDGKKQTLVATQLESHHAREAFPCVDEPEAKATFDLTLVSPIGESAIANTPSKSEEEKDGKLYTTFETTPKMSTYLVAFVYGDLQYKETKSTSGIDVRVWSTKVQPLDSLDFALDTAKRAIDFFEDYYGVPYPLAKSDHVAIPDFSAAAMENWGLITYREPFLIVDPKTTPQSAKEYVCLVISHELSHQWFGNLVTMKWWNDLWLNESFANVMEYLATDALFPEWKVWNMFVTQEGLAAFRRDSIAGVQSIKTEVNHPDEISTLFDPSIVYAKGGRLLNMLMQYIGQDAFRKGLKAYFTKHAYGNTTGNDLWNALGEASGQDVAAFMNPWLEKSNFPVIDVNQDDTKLSIQQSHFLLDLSKADDRLWPVPLLSDNTEVPDLLEAPAIDVTLSDGKYVRLNQGAVGHYIVNYAKPAHAEFIAGKINELGIAERLMLLSDSSMLSRAGTTSFAATLKLLERYNQEDRDPVWDIMALVIADARRFIDEDEALESAIKKMIRELIQTQYERLGWDENPDEPTQDTKLRATIVGLGVYSEHPEILTHALELFEAYKKDDNAVPAELRSIIFGAAVRREVDGAFDFLLKLDESTQNVDLKQDVLGALTLVKDKEHIDLLLGRLKDTDKVRAHEVDHWVVYLLRSRHARPQAWDWLRGNWDWIDKTFGGDKSYDYFPRYAASAFNTRPLLKEYKEFFEPLKDNIALNRNIVMGIEEIENRVAWLERDLAAVKKYFSK
jgi:aminopeptidase N